MDMDAFFVSVELLENPALRGSQYHWRPGLARSYARLLRARAHRCARNASVAPGTLASIPSCRCASRLPAYSRAVMAILHDHKAPTLSRSAWMKLREPHRRHCGQRPQAALLLALATASRRVSLPSSAGLRLIGCSPKWRPPVLNPSGLWVIPPEARSRIS